jgi:endonuclease YncB( thermonuclease family)
VQEHESIDRFWKIHMKLPPSALTAIAFALLATVSPVQAQTLNVSTSRTPMLTDVPTLNLPNQHDNTIGQAFSSPEQNAPLIPTETVNAPETLTPPKIPTTEITRGAEGMTISSPQDVVAPQKTPARDPEQAKYAIGMTLSGTAKVFDGHSFLIENYPVRLNGVDAPGLKQICTSTGGASWKCGQAARTYLKRLIEGKRLTCHVDALAGPGAAVSCSGAGLPDVTRMVVDAGMVVANGHGRKYEEAQAVAQRKRAGLWIGKFTNPIEWRRKNP